MSSETGRRTRHLTDEDWLLDYYGEASSADRADVQAHLAQCEECRTLDAELRAVLSAVETSALTEPPSGFEREMWARIEPLLPVRQNRARAWTGLVPRFALAAGVAAAIVTAFVAGRMWNNPPPEPPAQLATDGALNERLLRAEVEDHLERSQRVLVELVNANVDAGNSITGDQARAADLVVAGRLYRRSIEGIGDAEMSGLLEDLERVLVEVANEPADAGPGERARLRQRISEQDLVFRLRVVTTEMRERERRARQDW